MSKQNVNQTLDSKTVFWNRVQLIAIFVVFLAPIVGAFLYKPSQFNNYGDLYTPVRELSELSLVDVNTAYTSKLSDYADEDMWLFLVVAQGKCGTACEQSILNSRQLRAMQGKHLERLRSVFVYSGLSIDVARDLAKKYQPVEVYAADANELAQWATQLAPENIDGDDLVDRFYIVDSRGLLMISYPSDAEPKYINKDLKRLLKSRR